MERLRRSVHERLRLSCLVGPVLPPAGSSKPAPSEENTPSTIGTALVSRQETGWIKGAMLPPTSFKKTVAFPLFLGANSGPAIRLLAEPVLRHRDGKAEKSQGDPQCRKGAGTTDANEASRGAGLLCIFMAFWFLKISLLFTISLLCRHLPTEQRVSLHIPQGPLYAFLKSCSVTSHGKRASVNQPRCPRCQ